MSLQRIVRVSLEHPTSAVCVAGVETVVDIYGSVPEGTEMFEVYGTPGVDVYICPTLERSRERADTRRWHFDEGLEIVVVMNSPSNDLNDSHVQIAYHSSQESLPLAYAVLYLTCVDIALDCDLNREGEQDGNFVDKRQWVWGPGGHGAILLVNCDRDDPSSNVQDNYDQHVGCLQDLEDMSLMVLRTQGPAALFEDHRLVLHTSSSDARRARVFHVCGPEDSCGAYKCVLGQDKVSYEVPRLHGDEERFFVEGLRFPDAGFPGLLSFHVTLLDGSNEDFSEAPIFTDTVVFRVAPWIMTPSTLPPLEVYVCRVRNNTGFVEAVAELARKAGCKLTVCPQTENRNDRWIQDEMELGYVQAPHKTFPVVFDSPRNGELQEFPYKRILSASSGTHLVGSRGRRVTQVVRDFLHAQRVQPPVELFVDWLAVGHVDEFLSFVPAPDGKGFRMLLASPAACFRLFQEKKKRGHGRSLLFEGVIGNGRVRTISINQVLSNENLISFNKFVQSCIDWNREVLKRELGLADRDIIDIPQLFKSERRKATAFFPDLVNMLVLGKHLGIPKPFGPLINGRCCLEEQVRALLEPLGLHCTFIDDFTPYHMLHGEVHCGTNVRRQPFAFKWWHMVP
ncbi:peptidyl arginine deiminase 3 [Ictidomys tridecemlineatus]|uniref:protein-arginine deiminase type-3 n=1 Tax=Ictidomys tridecemlineatus TaxID=43179 RepID=UPI00038C5CF4|nr:protein-arginine deiminase type-3 [Ictidomys tridecemlineatus]KAG3282254.1 peptidyl arginine deiminase 3 [Ictidomys tridecemlineatus]